MFHLDKSLYEVKIYHPSNKKNLKETATKI